MSYSQYDEERFVLDAVKDVARSRWHFLDIGAWNAKTFSNTRALFELGWSGVLIEPSPGPMLNLLEAYEGQASVQLIQAAVGIDGGLAPMRVTSDAVSSSSDAEVAKWAASGVAFLGPLLVPIVTLEQIANQFGGFEFVNIDAEGLSADLFLRMIQIEWRPRCIVVEHDGRSIELLQAGTAHGYKCVYANGTNLVLAR